jgi:hypothetical protein
MQQAGRVHGLQGAAQAKADVADVFRRQRAAVAKHRLERPAFDELGPDPDFSVDALRSVNREDVGMTHAREEPRLLDRRGCGIRARRRDHIQELEGHVTFQALVPREIDAAGRSLAELPDDDQVPPAVPGWIRVRISGPGCTT